MEVKGISKEEKRIKVEVEVNTSEENLLEIQELLIQAQGNLRNTPRVAQAFLVFAYYQKTSWQKKQEKAGKPATEKEFFAQTPFSADFLRYLEQSNWSSLARAGKIANFYGILLEQAVAVGLGILQGDAPVETARKLVIAQENRDQIRFGGVCGNLRDYPEDAKALAAFIYTEYERRRSSRPETEEDTILRFCKRIDLSYTALLYLRKGGTENYGLSVVKAISVAEKFNLSLEQVVSFGKEILSAQAK